MEDLLMFQPHGTSRMSVEDVHALGSVVYFIFAENELLYVGQSKNFKHRMKMHRARFNEEAELIGDDRLRRLSVTAFSVPSEKLDEVEYYYIRKFLPPYNKDYLPEEIFEAHRKVRIAKLEVVMAQIELEEAIVEYHRKNGGRYEEMARSRPEETS